ncbi:hypothetical protein CXQ84_21985 [Burkholderia pseudomallei]|nr:hypothetical protein CXQ84_21985 [Burkholderia pseudomallei]
MPLLNRRRNGSEEIGTGASGFRQYRRCAFRDAAWETDVGARSARP